MANSGGQEAVLNILNEFKGLEPLKRLFWTELNYEQVNEPLSRHGFSDIANKALAEDPVLFAAGGSGNQFHIIYSRLASDRLLIGQERPIVSKLLNTHPYTLFIFSNSHQDRWHFLNVKYDEQSSKRRLFRRITIGPEERLRTASERIAMLDPESINPSLFGISPLDIQAAHDKAFDVEAVQKEFFKTFAELYHKVIEDIEQVQNLKKDAGKLAQLLLDRMLFLYFIQKKGWLDQSPDYLYIRFREHWKKDPQGNSYYTDILYPLFLTLSNADTKINTVGSVPFLNGGLFEEDIKQTQIERLNQARLHLKNATFKVIFDDLLEKFNFTITEDTPLDVEVAIDPEMLGKIFENLILQLEKNPEKDLRKITGSYYTPRPIVHFMCQEAFKEYLVTQLAGEDSNKADVVKEKVQTLISLPPADHLDDEQISSLRSLFTNTEAASLIHSIYNCKVCDPAVGSGAFLVGMLHEMVTTIAKLDFSSKGSDVLAQRNYDYDLKKRIIESCLYGVDIQEQAVRLCELRLWLSLVVDYQVDRNIPFDKAIREVPSLPNLSYRVVQGDSLLERLFGHVVNLDQMATDAKTKQIIESIQADKQSYFRESKTDEKHRLELKILVKQADLAERLIIAKTDELSHYQAQLFGEATMSAKERKAKEEHEQQIKELDELKTKVAKAKSEIEQLARQKRVLVKGDIDTLRRQYFHTEGHPTFIWHVDFAEVFIEKGGFDIVIANPPYVSYGLRGNKSSKKGWASLIKTHYVRSAEYKISMYAIFMDRGLSLNCSGGISIYITPDSYLLGRYFSKLRRRILDIAEIKSIFMFEEDFWESGVVGRPTIITCHVKRPTKEFKLNTRLCKNIEMFLKHSWEDYSYEQCYFENIKFNRFRLFFSFQDKVFVERIEKNAQRLGNIISFASGLIGLQGQETIVAEIKKGQTWHRGINSGGDILPYRIHYSGKYLNFDLSKLKSGFKEAQYSKPKLLIRQTEDSLIAAYDPDGFYCLNNVHVGNSLNPDIDIRIIVAILNSQIMNRYYRIISLETDRAMAQTDIDVLEELPFIRPSHLDEIEIIDIVSKLQTGKLYKNDEDRLIERLNIIIQKTYNINL